jgi:uncharacterized protein (DUF305 family)
MYITISIILYGRLDDCSHDIDRAFRDESNVSGPATEYTDYCHKHSCTAWLFLLIRQQTAITDRQFLRLMIPHHAGAILMCEQASLQDTEIKELCQTIISSQQAEIDQMKATLSELEK